MAKHARFLNAFMMVLLLTGCSYVYSSTSDTGKHHYNTTIKGARIKAVNGGVNGTTANGVHALP